MSTKGNALTFGILFKGKSVQEDGRQFLQRVAYYGFTQILCARKAIHNAAFVKKAVDGQLFRLYVLNKDSEFVAKRVHSKLIGMMDAISKGFLKEAILVISNNPENSDDAIEVFTMRFVYRDVPHMELTDGRGDRILSTIAYRGAENAESDFFKLLTDITLLCQVLEKLPKGAYCSFRSTFYDVAPSDYTPSGWYDSGSLYQWNHPEALESFDLGNFHTPESALFLAVKSFAITDEVEVMEAMKRMKTASIDRNESLNKSLNFDGHSFLNEIPQRNEIISGSINGINQKQKDEKLVVKMDQLILEAANQEKTPPPRRNLRSSKQKESSETEEKKLSHTGPIKKGRKPKSKLGETVLPASLKKTYRLDQSTPGDATPVSST